jgi:ribosome-associated protein
VGDSPVERDAGAAVAEDAQVSKSQRKRDALAIRSLAAELLEMGDTRLRRLALDESVMRAVEEARHIRSHIAHKRQLQFVAKLLRRHDTAAIEAAIAADRAEARALHARHHRAEAWRDRLLQDGDAALSDLIAVRPGIDAQSMRQLIRRASREARNGRPPAAARSLFRMLRDLDQAEPLPAMPAVR